MKTIQKAVALDFESFQKSNFDFSNERKNFEIELNKLTDPFQRFKFCRISKYQVNKLFHDVDKYLVPIDKGLEKFKSNQEQNLFLKYDNQLYDLLCFISEIEGKESSKFLQYLFEIFFFMFDVNYSYSNFYNILNATVANVNFWEEMDLEFLHKKSKYFYQDTDNRLYKKELEVE